MRSKHQLITNLVNGEHGNTLTHVLNNYMIHSTVILMIQSTASLLGFSILQHWHAHENDDQEDLR